MAVATYEDVAVSLGRPITEIDEQDQIEWWLESAELQIRARLGDVSLLDQDVLKYVEVEAVAARAQNPDSFAYEAVDDYRYGRPPESRRVAILDEWWHMLDPDAGNGAFAVRPGFEADTVRWAGNNDLFRADTCWDQP